MGFFSLPNFFGSKTVFGLDIGSYSIKLAELTLTKQKIFLEKLSVTLVPPGIIAHGEINNQTLLVQTLQKALHEFKPKTKNVAIGLKGATYMVKFLELPFVEQEVRHEQILWEVEQYIPFELDDVAIDYHILNNPSPHEKMKVLVVAGKKSAIVNYRDVVAECGLKLAVVDIDAFALQNMFELAYKITTPEIFVLMDIGASSIKINILEEGITLFSRDLELGGNTYTYEIMKRLSLNYDEAEALKIGDGKNSIPKLGLEAIDEINAQIGDEVAKQVDFYKNALNRKHKVAQILVSGGASQTVGLLSLLSKKLASPVNQLNPFEKVAYNKDKFGEQQLQRLAAVVPVAMGLAARKIGDHE